LIIRDALLLLYTSHSLGPGYTALIVLFVHSFNASSYASPRSWSLRALLHASRMTTNLIDVIASENRILEHEHHTRRVQTLKEQVRSAFSETVFGIAQMFPKMPRTAILLREGVMRYLQGALVFFVGMMLGARAQRT
jgi:hypothetical protein